MIIEFDDFLQGYVAAAIWVHEEEISNEAHRTPAIEGSSLTEIRELCWNFYSKAWPFIRGEKLRRLDFDLAVEGGYISLAGHDFYLTSNHHGSGFWDGGWVVYGHFLTNISRMFPEVSLEFDPDTNMMSFVTGQCPVFI